MCVGSLSNESCSSRFREFLSKTKYYVITLKLLPTLLLKLNIFKLMFFAFNISPNAKGFFRLSKFIFVFLNKEQLNLAKHFRTKLK